MQRHIFILGLFIIILLTGCNDNQNINDSKVYEDTLEQLEKTTAEKKELEKELNNAELELKPSYNVECLVKKLSGRIQKEIYMRFF